MNLTLWSNISGISELLGRLPTADREGLVGLASASDFQAWAIAKADEYRKFALTLLSLHNLAAPIHRFPPEILDLILEQCWHNRASLRISHVCRLWRSILLDRPTFWADALSGSEFHGQREFRVSELPYLETLLARSTLHTRQIKPSFYGFSSAVAMSLTPYVRNIVSLQVTVGEYDLHHHLWPALCSGMPNLATLGIQIMVTEEDMEDVTGDIWFYSATIWTDEFSVLPEDSLPLLTRLTCPRGLLDYFSYAPLQHLKLQWWDPKHRIDTPNSYIGATGKHLLSHRDTLRTLEIVDHALDEFIPESPSTIELPYLEYLRVQLINPGDAAHLLSFLSIPPTARIHIINASDILYQFYFPGPLPHNNPRNLHALVGDVDRLHIQHVRSREHAAVIRAYAGDVERLRIDGFGIPPLDFVDIFRIHARITRLVLSAMHLPSRLNAIHDFNRCLRAFPHVTHLNIGGPDAERWVNELQPEVEKRKGTTRAESGLVSPSLTELAVSFNKLSRVGGGDPGLRRRCSVIHRVLAKRASLGSRLSYLELHLPAQATLTLYGSGLEDGDLVQGGSEERSADNFEQSREGDSAALPSDSGQSADSDSEESVDSDSEQSVDSVSDECADDGGSNRHPKCGSGSSMDTRSDEESGAHRPSLQSILQSLRELVDGPVIIKVCGRNVW